MSHALACTGDLVPLRCRAETANHVPPASHTLSQNQEKGCQESSRTLPTGELSPVGALVSALVVTLCPQASQRAEVWQRQGYGLQGLMLGSSSTALISHLQ